MQEHKLQISLWNYSQNVPSWEHRTGEKNIKVTWSFSCVGLFFQTLQNFSPPWSSPKFQPTQYSTTRHLQLNNLFCEKSSCFINFGYSGFLWCPSKGPSQKFFWENKNILSSMRVLSNYSNVTITKWWWKSPCEISSEQQEWVRPWLCFHKNCFSAGLWYPEWQIQQGKECGKPLCSCTVSKGGISSWSSFYCLSQGPFICILYRDWLVFN